MTEVKTENPLKQIQAYGQSLWYDGLVSRQEFERMIREDGVRGATTNPAIFEKALGSGEYDDAIRAFAKSMSEEEIYQTLAVKAVQEVADVFGPVFDQTEGQDGFVSMEVSPLLAYDTQATLEEARRLHRWVNRKNLMIKVPATREGIPAVEALIAEGINVNITLIFSVERHKEVMNAYLSGLEKRLSRGEPVSGVASVASFFVSRVDTLVGSQLQEKMPSLAGQAGIANSKAAYEEFERVFGSERFQKLKAKGAQAQRPLWASTGTKNPRYRDVLYVEELMGPRTVNTIPPATLAAFRDHGIPRSRLKEGLVQARRTLEQLKEAGIVLEEVTEKLERDGVIAFADAYKKILQCLRAKMK